MTGISFTPKFAISPYVAPALVNRNPKTENKEWFFEAVNETASEYWEISRLSLFSEGRFMVLVKARAFCYYMLNRHPSLPMSTVEIGKRYFRHHSSIIHSLKRVQDALNGFDPDYLFEFMEAEALLREKYYR